MNIKDCLSDLIKHTLPVGIETVKYTCEDGNVLMGGLTDDKTIIINSITHKDVDGFNGIFGINNISKLSALLNLEPYQENGVLELHHKEDGTPTNIHFENSEGTFKNDHRFMSTADITEKLKSTKLKKIPEYVIEIEPPLMSITMLGYQAGISDEEVFTVKTEDKNLKFFFGDHSTHAGEFVFASDVVGKMSGKWMWFVGRVLPILKLGGEQTMYFSDEGMLKITVDSGLALYEYMLPGTQR